MQIFTGALQKHMPAVSLFCIATLSIGALTKLQCTGVRVACTGVCVECKPSQVQLQTVHMPALQCLQFCTAPLLRVAMQNRLTAHVLLQGTCTDLHLAHLCK